MTILSLTKNRKELRDEIARITGNKLRFQGPPSFAYTDGTFTLDRDGNLEVKDIISNVGVLKELAAKRLIDNSWDNDRDIISIDIPVGKHTGQSLVRLVQIMWNKEHLINKAVDSPAGFKISHRFIEKLVEEPPTSVSEFLFLWEQSGGSNATAGIDFDEKKIHFTGFPYTQEPEWIRAYMDLATAISEEAIVGKKVRLAKPQVENEKYYFRVWLVRIGLSGDAFKTTRKKLLLNLSGNSAFKTDAQALEHKNKYGRKKQ